MRGLYKYTKEYNLSNPLKVKARKIFNRAIEKGLVNKKPCILCGDILSEAHHYDYDLPFNVLWVCKEHHWWLHSSMEY